MSRPSDNTHATHRADHIEHGESCISVSVGTRQPIESLGTREGESAHCSSLFRAKILIFYYYYYYYLGRQIGFVDDHDWRVAHQGILFGN
jgi:hypothetical protein